MADPGVSLKLIFAKCFEVMQMEFIVFGIKISYWDVFVWSIIMVALLRLFYRLFE